MPIPNYMSVIANVYNAVVLYCIQLYKTYSLDKEYEKIPYPAC